MIQKHCFECGTALIEKELEEEGIVPYCPKCQQYRFPMYNVAGEKLPYLTCEA